MKLTELRQIIRAEMKSVLKEELKDIKFLVDVLTEASTIKKVQPTKNRGVKADWADWVEEVKPQSNIDWGTKNTLLANMLNETDNSMTTDDYSTVLDMNSNNALGFKQSNTLAPSTNFDGQPVQVPDELAPVFSRDYSALMDKLL